MKVEYKNIEGLVPYEKNAKLHPDSQVAKIARSIQEFGFRNPVLVDGQGGIIAGHGRVLAARQAGLTEVPVIRADDLTEEQVRAYRIADNKLAESDWDWDLVAAEVEGLKGSDFDIELTGFDVEEIAPIFDPEIPLGDGKDEEGGVQEILKSATLEEMAPTDEELKILKDKKILVSFSGGKDSSAAALWARHYLPDNEIELCFADIGADFITMPMFMQQFSEATDLKLVTVRSSYNVIDMMLNKGKWPHFSFPYCHDLLHKALDDYSLKHDPDNIIFLRGGRLQEKKGQVKAQNTRFMYFNRSKMREYIAFQPLYFAEKGVAESVIQESNAPTWDGYKYGCQRTACRCCPGQKPRAYAAIRQNYPDVWDELLWLESKLGLGYWHDPTNGGLNLDQLADRGQPLFEGDDYPHRFKRG